jgi:hypothetical protein
MKSSSTISSRVAKLGRRPSFWAALLASLLVALIFGIVTAQIWKQSDYVAHVDYSRSMAITGYFDSPTFTFQQFTLIIRALIPFTLLRVFGPPFTTIFPEFSFQIAAFLTAILFYVFLGQLIFNRVKQENAALPQGMALALCMATPIVLELVAPINIFTLLNKDLYIGYVGINDYHNPTIVLLKPLSLLLFWFVLDKLSPPSTPTKDSRNGLFLAILSALFLLAINLFTKPNFIMCFLPALWIVAILLRIRKERVNWWLLLLGMTIPAVLLLFLQYSLTYVTDPSSGIAFAPLQSMLIYIPSVPGLVFRLILSFLFPLVMLICFPRDVVNEKRLLVAYIAFFFGLLYSCLLEETGTRATHGNFWWGAEVTLFILFVELVLFLFRKYASALKSRGRDWRLWLASSVLLLHFFCGILWYFAEVLRPHQWWGI